jgi:hypothetical protein
MILYFLLVLIIILIAIASFAAREAQKKALLTAQTLEQMEEKYDLFVNACLVDNPLEKYNLQVDPIQLSKDALLHLDKEIKQITSLLNAGTRSIVRINYVAKFFPNLIDLIESYYRINQKNNAVFAASFEIQQLKNALLDAINADVQKRLLQLNIGNP